MLNISDIIFELGTGLFKQEITLTLIYETQNSTNVPLTVDRAKELLLDVFNSNS